MDVLEGPDGFQLNDDKIFDDEIESVFADLMILIEKRDRLLTDKGDPVQRELDGQRFLVNRLQKSRTQVAVQT